jgi:hypothetical protein
VKAARRVREAVRGNGPVERPEPRPGPTSQHAAAASGAPVAPATRRALRRGSPTAEDPATAGSRVGAENPGTASDQRSRGQSTWRSQSASRHHDRSLRPSDGRPSAARSGAELEGAARPITYPQGNAPRPRTHLEVSTDAIRCVPDGGSLGAGLTTSSGHAGACTQKSGGPLRASASGGRARARRCLSRTGSATRCSVRDQTSR